MGRPKSKNPRDKRLEIKLTQEELDKINNCSLKYGKSRTDTILYGIDLVNDEIGKK